MKRESFLTLVLFGIIGLYLSNKSHLACKREIIESYGLVSYDEGKKERLMLCPSIQFSCCPAFEQMKMFKNLQEKKPGFILLFEVIQALLLKLEEILTPIFKSGTITQKIQSLTDKSFNGPAHIVFAAWTTPALFMRWWAPKSTGVPLLSCEMDVRVGGGYRVAFGQDAATSFAFFGKYLEVIPNARLVWTNEESADAAVTTLTLEEKAGKTLLTLHERYPSKQALDAAGTGAADAMPEQFEQLDALLVTLGGGEGGA